MTIIRHAIAPQSRPTKTGSGTAWRARNTTSGLVSIASVPMTALRRVSSRLAATNMRMQPSAVSAAKGRRAHHSV